MVRSSGVGAREIFVRVVVRSSIVALALYKLFVICDSGLPGLEPPVPSVINVSERWWCKGKK